MSWMHWGTKEKHAHGCSACNCINHTWKPSKLRKTTIFTHTCVCIRAWDYPIHKMSINTVLSFNFSSDHSGLVCTRCTPHNILYYSIRHKFIKRAWSLSTILAMVQLTANCCLAIWNFSVLTLLAGSLNTPCTFFLLLLELFRLNFFVEQENSGYGLMHVLIMKQVLFPF